MLYSKITAAVDSKVAVIAAHPIVGALTQRALVATAAVILGTGVVALH